MVLRPTERTLKILLTTVCTLFVCAACTTSTREDAASAASAAPSMPEPETVTPAGQALTPLATPGAAFVPLDPGFAADPDFRAGQPVTTVVSPDGDTLMVLTSGYNRMDGIEGESSEYLFVYDISGGKPAQQQVLQLPNTYMGIAFAPDGQHVYVAGGVDNNVHVIALEGGRWSETGTIATGTVAPASIPAGAAKGGVGFGTPPEAAGVAVSGDGRTLVVANLENDSISIVDLTAPAPVGVEVSLRPGSGVAGGEFPLWVAIRGNDTAYVSSMRDREVDVVDLAAHRVVKRIPVAGNPNRMLLGHDGATLYVACDNEAQVAVISTERNEVVASVTTTAPAGYIGAAPGGDAFNAHGTAANSLALAPDGSRLYVTNGGTNSVAVIALYTSRPEVIGLIPTGYYPNSISVSRDGGQLYIVNGKTADIANPCRFKLAANAPESCRDVAGRNQYILQLSKGAFLTEPTPDVQTLARLTRQVADNNHFGFRESAEDAATMAFLRDHIRHVIYIVRENRTYDQILGDLGRGNGDPRLTEFGRSVTPNAHALAEHFVDFDNFLDTGEVSGNGWPWSTSARESDFGARSLSVNYANRGLSYDWEGTNRNVAVGMPTTAERRAANPDYPDDPDLLPGTGDVAAPDGPDGQPQRGYLWSGALRAGLDVRNYGFAIDLRPYAKGTAALERDPHRTNTPVAFSTNPELTPVTDVYFRGFDDALPDHWREQEWEREFDGHVKRGHLPALELVRFMNDHTGAFGRAIDGVNTPTRQIADNDFAVGRLIEKVANSPFADSTLIFVVEDDAQNGPDHVNAHRSVAFIAGPYVKQGAVIGTRYSTVNLLRTIEDVLGIPPLTLNDAYQRPMADAFDPGQASWTYDALYPSPLAATAIPDGGHRHGPAAAVAAAGHDARHDADWWSAQTADYDWSKEDRIPTVAYNHLLWSVYRPGQPYPQVRDDDAVDVAFDEDGYDEDDD